MKKIGTVLNAGPVKWLGIYVILISTIAFIFSTFKSQSLTDSAQMPDSTLKKITKLAVMNKDKGNSGNNISKERKKAKISEANLISVEINPLQIYLEKYNAVDFSNYSFPFTIDYQENLKNKTVLFYIVVQDIFEENKQLYIKAAKSSFGLNIYLKLECKKSQIEELKKARFFTYAVVKIKRVDNIYFNAKAASGDDIKEDASITLSSSDKNLLIYGECVAIFEK